MLEVCFLATFSFMFVVLSDLHFPTFLWLLFDDLGRLVIGDLNLFLAGLEVDRI